MNETINNVSLNFDPGSLVALNVILGLIMFGIALSLRLDDFRYVVKRPRAPLIGLVSQFVLLPAGTWGLTRLLDVPPSIALGMILVSSCPGGNISNFIAYMSRSNTALSVSITAVSTSLAVVMTPLNVTFWGSVSPDTRSLLTDFSIDPQAMFFNVLVLLVVPLIAGMAVGARFPKLAERITRPFKIGGAILFVGFIVVAFQSNAGVFTTVIGIIFVPVALHNALAWVLGFGAGRLAGLATEDTRAVSIEVAIQNSALGLVLIFGYFDGLGGMATVAAWWGIWHIVAGLFMGTIWGNIFDRKSRSSQAEAQ